MMTSRSRNGSRGKRERKETKTKEKSETIIYLRSENMLHMRL